VGRGQMKGAAGPETAGSRPLKNYDAEKPDCPLTIALSDVKSK